ASRRQAGGKLTEDAADDFGLSLIDHPLAADRLPTGIDLAHHVIAVAQPAAGLPDLDPAAQAAMGLGGKVLEEQRVHRALESDMEIGDLAFGQRHDRHTGELEALVERSHALLVARQPVERFGDDDVEASGPR